ncbi:MAG: hypothetical protein KDA96_21630, partial [Planctomycetaceae bacterium]|nr:hypothetical protein [Planctomycetaceae bacterium]
MLLSRNVLLPLFTLISCWSASFTNTLSAAAPCPARAVRSEQYLCIRNFPDLNGDESLRQRMRDADKPLIDLLDAASLPIGSFNVTAWEVRQGQAARNSSTVPLVEFYDLKQDPRCQRNLAATRENQPTIQIMRQIMDAELIRANDPRETVPGYQNQNVEGWPFRVSQQLLRDQPAETDTALQLLKEQLQLVIKVLPRPALGKVRNVPIWLSPPYANARPTGEYHPGADWLRTAGRRPELVRCVEFTNIDIMRQEVRRMPMMVLHELAHAYHDQKLGFDHPAIKTT